MRTRTNNFKLTIKEMGRQIDSRITLSDNTILDGEKLFSINPILNTDLLKSVMKGLKFECSEELDIGDSLKYEFGLLVGNSFEWINFGYYYVNEKEYNEDTKNWNYTCYDKMLLSMVDYNGLQNGSFPMTVRSYINSLCTDLGITFADSSSTFTNYDREINSDLYVDVNGNSLGYTYRDIFDELSAVVAGNIMVNNNEQLFIKYPTETSDTIDEEYFKDINVTFGEKFGPLNTVILMRSGDSDGIYKTYPNNLPEEDRIAIEIKDNQIMNGNDRADYCQEILDKLKGLEFYLNDYKSTGILYYEALDLYTVSIDGNSYECLMLNDEPKIEKGLTEDIYTELPEEVVTEYKNMSDDDRKISQVYIIAKKNEGVIEAVVQTVDNINVQINGDYYLTNDTTFQANKQYYEKDGESYVEYTDYEIGDPVPSNTIYEYTAQNSLEERVRKAELQITSQGAMLDVVSTNIDPVTGDVLNLKRTNYEIGQNGFITTGDDGYKAVRNTTGDYFYDNDTMTGKYTKDGSVQKDFALFGKYYYGIDEDLDVENFTKDDAMFIAELYTDNNGDVGFGHFYNQS